MDQGHRELRMLIVADVYGGNVNGTILATDNLATAMRERGHEVRIICGASEYKGKDGFFVVDNIHLPRFLKNYVDKNGVTLAKPQEDVIREALDGVDLVHCMQPLILGPAVARIAAEMGIPTFAGFHTQPENILVHLRLLWASFLDKSMYRSFYSKLYSYCAGIHYPSQFVRDVFERAIGHDTPGWVIPNGVEDDFLSHPEPFREEGWEGKYLIVNSGRFSREKNQEVLIDAVSRSKHRDSIKLVLAGRGPTERELERRIERAGIDAELRTYDIPQLARVLAACDLYVHPSVVDIAPTSCIEALCCGALPLLSDSKRAYNRLMARDPRCVFKTHSARDLASHIDWFIEHPSESSCIRDRYSDVGDNLHIPDCMDRMEEMYLTTLRLLGK